MADWEVLPQLHRFYPLAVLGTFTWASFKLLAALLRDDSEDKADLDGVKSDEISCKKSELIPLTLARVPAVVLDAVRGRLSSNSSSSIWAERVVEVPTDLIARFIGRRGRNIFDLREKRLVQIKIVKINSAVNYVFVFGRKTHVEEVVRLINKQLLGFRLECHLRLGVPQEYISSIIGRQGSVINEIREDTSARIEIPKQRRLTKFSFDNHDNHRFDNSRYEKPQPSNGQNGLLLFPEIKTRPIKYNPSISDFDVNDVDAVSTKNEGLDVESQCDEEGSVADTPGSINDEGELNLVFISGLPHHVAHAHLKILQIIGRAYRARKRRREAFAGRAVSRNPQEDEEDRERWENLGKKPGGLRFSALDDDDAEPVEYQAFSPPTVITEDAAVCVVDEKAPLGDKIAASIHAKISAAAAQPSLWDSDECTPVVSDRPPFPIRARFHAVAAQEEESDFEDEYEYETVEMNGSVADVRENKLDTAANAANDDSLAAPKKAVTVENLLPPQSGDDVKVEICTPAAVLSDADENLIISVAATVIDDADNGTGSDFTNDREINTSSDAHIDDAIEPKSADAKAENVSFVFKSKHDIEAAAVAANNDDAEIDILDQSLVLEDPYGSASDEDYTMPN